MQPPTVSSDGHLLLLKSTLRVNGSSPGLLQLPRIGLYRFHFGKFGMKKSAGLARVEERSQSFDTDRKSRTFESWSSCVQESGLISLSTRRRIRPDRETRHDYLYLATPEVRT